MRTIANLALFFVKSFIRQKTTLLMLLLTLLFIAIAWVVSGINIATKYKLFEDVLLTSQGVLLHLFASLYTFEFLQKERIGGIFILPLSTGLKRSSYLASVVLAQWMMLIVLFTIFFSIDLTVLWVVEGEIRFSFLWQVTLFLVSASILSLLIIVLSQFVSVMNSMIYALTLYFMGNGLDEIYRYAYIYKINPFLQELYKVLEFLIPQFYLFDKQGVVVNRALEPASSFIFYPLVYALIAVILLFSIARWKFEKRALKVGE